MSAKLMLHNNTLIMLFHSTVHLSLFFILHTCTVANNCVGNKKYKTNVFYDATDVYDVNEI